MRLITRLDAEQKQGLVPAVNRQLLEIDHVAVYMDAPKAVAHLNLIKMPSHMDSRPNQQSYLEMK